MLQAERFGLATNFGFDKLNIQYLKRFRYADNTSWYLPVRKILDFNWFGHHPITLGFKSLISTRLQTVGG